MQSLKATLAQSLLLVAAFNVNEQMVKAQTKEYIYLGGRVVAIEGTAATGGTGGTGGGNGSAAVPIFNEDFEVYSNYTFAKPVI